MTTAPNQPESQLRPLAEAVIGGLDRIFGQHPGRVAHTKGTCVVGRYEPASGVSRITKARALTEAGTVVARFSMAGGDVSVSEKSNTTRGLSVHFAPHDADAAVDLIAISAPIFDYRTPEQMATNLNLIADGDTAGQAAFAEANPEIRNQANWAAGTTPPSSYLSGSYYPVHTYYLSNDAGDRTAVRFRIRPQLGEERLTPEQVASGPDRFLDADLSWRLKAAPAVFVVEAAIASDQDAAHLHDPTFLMPFEDRAIVTLGTVTITEIAPAGDCDVGVFDVSRIASGIEGDLEDQIYRVRSAAYAISAARRGLQKPA